MHTMCGIVACGIQCHAHSPICPYLGEKDKWPNGVDERKANVDKMV